MTDLKDWEIVTPLPTTASKSERAKQAVDRVCTALEGMAASDFFCGVREESARQWEQHASEGEAKRAAIIELLRGAGAEII